MKTPAKRIGSAACVGLPVEAVRIERNVPLPEKPAPYTTQRAVYPFAQMQIGDSFETGKASVSSAARKFRLRMAARGEVVVLVVRKQKSGKYRCWRVELGEAPPPRAASRKARPRARAAVKAPTTPRATS